MNPIYLHEGQASLTLSSFATTIVFQSSTDKLHLQLSGFSVTCGSLTVRWSLIKAEDKCNLGRNNATLSSNSNNHILVGLNLENIATYKVVVQANNIREQLGLPVCSNPVTIDTSTPTGVGCMMVQALLIFSINQVRRSERHGEGFNQPTVLESTKSLCSTNHSLLTIKLKYRAL